MLFFCISLCRDFIDVKCQIKSDYNTIHLFAPFMILLYNCNFMLISTVGILKSFLVVFITIKIGSKVYYSFKLCFYQIALFWKNIIKAAYTGFKIWSHGYLFISLLLGYFELWKSMILKLYSELRKSSLHSDELFEFMLNLVKVLGYASATIISKLNYY